MPVGLLLPVPHRRAHHVVLTLWRHIDTIQHVRRGPLAQLVEQRPFKAWVTGSNPVWLKRTDSLHRREFFCVSGLKRLAMRTEVGRPLCDDCALDR